MRSTRFLFWLRRLVAALLVVSLVATPALAAAESPESHSEMAFICDDGAEVSGEPSHTHHDAHGHTAHGCGTCHFHWLGSKAEIPLLTERVAPAGADVTAGQLVRLAAAGPYRPPRS